MKYALTVQRIVMLPGAKPDCQNVRANLPPARLRSLRRSPRAVARFTGRVALALSLLCATVVGGQTFGRALVPPDNRQPATAGEGAPQAAWIGALAAFEGWETGYLGAIRGHLTARTGGRSVAEGIALAKQRRAVMALLIRTDPKRALALAASAGRRGRLPAPVAAEFETAVSGVGDFIVLGVDSAPGGPSLAPVQRRVRLNGRVYRASVYGRRLSETTKLGVPLRGVALDGVLAVQAQVLRELRPDQVPLGMPVADLRTAIERVVAGTAPVLAEMGSRVYGFGSQCEFRAAEARLEGAEAGLGPRPTRPATAILASGPFPPRERKASQPLAAASWTIGPKRILIIRVDFSDLPGDPKSRDGVVYTAAYVQDIADRLISPYFQKSSYGLTTLSNTVTSLYRMPHPAAYYATNDMSEQLHTDAENLAQSDYPLADYDRWLVLFSALDGISGSELQYGGLANIGGPRVWLNGEFDFRSVAHELGHTEGLFHADLWQVADGNPISSTGREVDAGDVFDTMGANYANDSRTDFNPWFKSLLGWLPAAQVQTVNVSGVYRLDRFDTAAASGTLALKVAKDATRDYWIGLRGEFTNNPSLSRGAYIVWGHLLDQPSDLLDMSTSGTNLQDAALGVGATFADPAAQLMIHPIAYGVSPDLHLDVLITLPPVITNPPADQMVVPGQTAVFSVGAVGNPPPGYQWQRAAVGGAIWTNLLDDATYHGTTGATLLVTAPTKTMSGDQFQCVLTNLYGSVTSSPPVQLTVDAEPPVILKQPEGQTVAPGDNALFTLVATGYPPPAYQWQRRAAGGTNWISLVDLATYSGAASPELTVNAATVAMNGDHFQCVVTNLFGQATSSPPALLSVNVRLVITTFAGSPGACGAVDGPGTQARFDAPSGIAVDSRDNVYVADASNQTIRKVTPDGTVSTLAGQAGSAGSADGVGSDARFNMPSGIAVGGDGSIYVADTGNDTIRSVTPAGVVTTLAGRAGQSGSTDGAALDARFNAPTGVAVDGSGNAYVADTGNDTIRKITSAGTVSTLAGLAGNPGAADAKGNAARFSAPMGVAADSLGFVYVADTGNHTIRRVAPDGTVNTLAGLAGNAGSADGTGPNARFNAPSGLAPSATATGAGQDLPSTIYVADSLNQTLRKVTPAGLVSTLAGSAGEAGSGDGADGNARFNHPAAIAVDLAGQLYVADSGNCTVRLGQIVLLPPPALGMFRLGSLVLLWWPAVATGFVPESTASLTPAMAWQVVTNGSLSFDDRWFFLTTTVNAPRRFFRLRQP